MHREKNPFFVICDLQLITSGIDGFMIISLYMDPQFEAFILDDTCTVKGNTGAPYRFGFHTVPDQSTVVGNDVSDHIGDADAVDQLLYT